MSDDVNFPTHYNQKGIEVIDVIEAYTPDSPHLANVIKYVCRHSYKGNALKDLKKASWYLDRAIVLLEQDESPEFHASLASRIPGETPEAEKLKDEYYNFDRFQIIGYCANCDKELALGCPYVKSFAFDGELKFCGHSCVDKLKDWQGR